MRMVPKMVGQLVRVLSMAVRVTATSRYISSIALVLYPESSFRSAALAHCSCLSINNNISERSTAGGSGTESYSILDPSLTL